MDEILYNGLAALVGGAAGWFLERIRAAYTAGPVPEPDPVPVIKPAIGIAVSGKMRNADDIERHITAALHDAILNKGVSVEDTSGLKRIIEAAREEALIRYRG